MAQCISSFGVLDANTNQTFPVPCGKCYYCVQRLVSAWSFRLMQEDKIAQTAYFVTLTYDNDHVPISAKRYMTLRKKDVQEFMKRLRYYSPKTPKIKYYAVGEYGSDTKRPHYHIILFNAEPLHVEQAWTAGQCFFGTVAGASVGYTLKYVSKKGQIPVHANDDRVPEFALMSKRLGANYLTPQMKRWHEEDILNRMYLNIEGGKKICMPRYYKDQLYTKEQRQHIGAHLSTKMADELAKAIEAYGPKYAWDKAQNDIATFRKKGYQANKNNKL